MRKIAALLSVGVFALSASAAEDTPATTIAPFVDNQTVVIVRVQVDKVKMEALTEWLNRFAPPGLPLEPVQLWLDAFTKAKIKEVFAAMSLSDPLGQPFAVIPLGKGTEVEALKPALDTLPSAVTTEVRNGFMLIGSPRVLKRVRDAGGRPRAEVGEAFAAAEGSALQVVGLLPPLVRRSLRELMPRLPQEIGGDSFEVLDKGMRWAALAVDFPPRASLRLTIQSENAEAAKALADLLKRGIDLLAKNYKADADFEAVAPLLPLLTPKTDGARVVVRIEQEQLAKLVAPAVGKVRLAAMRTQSINNLKQLALAMHNYVDVKKTFPPPANYDAKGKALLSWRVHLLPFLEQDALYKEFHLKEGWDSEHNKKLISRMPVLFRSPLQKNDKPGMTTYLAPVGKDTMFPDRKGVRFADVSDGLSNTILLVEVNDANAVIWTKPDDLDIGAANLLTRLLRPELTVFLVAFADGSVRALSGSLDLETLRLLLLRNDGKVVNLP